MYKNTKNYSQKRIYIFNIYYMRICKKCNNENTEDQYIKNGKVCKICRNLKMKEYSSKRRKDNISYQRCEDIDEFIKITELHEINKKGVIRNIKSLRIMKHYITYDGYVVINLTIKGKSICNRVHRLVAESFLENEFNKPEVDHIDRNPLNNNLENLRWATKKENLSNRGFLFSEYKIEYFSDLKNWRVRVNNIFTSHNTLEDAYLFLSNYKK